LKLAILAVAFVVAGTPADAQDMAQMISQYRRDHGLSAVKTDPQLTAIAERQANAMAASGIMDHNVVGSFVSRVSGAGGPPPSEVQRRGLARVFLPESA